jgi:hypothetical protein
MGFLNELFSQKKDQDQQHIEGIYMPGSMIAGHFEVVQVLCGGIFV